MQLHDLHTSMLRCLGYGREVWTRSKLLNASRQSLMYKTFFSNLTGSEGEGFDFDHWIMLAWNLCGGEFKSLRGVEFSPVDGAETGYGD